MTTVVDYEEFAAFKEEVRKEQEENRFYREVVCQLVWLSRSQAAEVLNVSDATMHRIIKSRRIPFRAEGNRQLFSITDLVSYLTAQKISPSSAYSRVSDTLYHHA